MKIHMNEIYEFLDYYTMDTTKTFFVSFDIDETLIDLNFKIIKKTSLIYKYLQKKENVIFLFSTYRSGNYQNLTLEHLLYHNLINSNDIKNNMCISSQKSNGYFDLVHDKRIYLLFFKYPKYLFLKKLKNIVLSIGDQITDLHVEPTHFNSNHETLVSIFKNSMTILLPHNSKLCFKTIKYI
jgi:hypothetical protein